MEKTNAKEGTVFHQCTFNYLVIDSISRVHFDRPPLLIEKFPHPLTPIIIYAFPNDAMKSKFITFDYVNYIITLSARIIRKQIRQRPHKCVIDWGRVFNPPPDTIKLSFIR